MRQDDLPIKKMTIKQELLTELDAQIEHLQQLKDKVSRDRELFFGKVDPTRLNFLIDRINGDRSCDRELARQDSLQIVDIHDRGKMQEIADAVEATEPERKLRSVPELVADHKA